MVFLAELARREGAFGPDDVVRGIVDKLVRRHPHVFGDVERRRRRDEVLTQLGADQGRRRRRARGVLDGVPRCAAGARRARSAWARR